MITSTTDAVAGQEILQQLRARAAAEGTDWDAERLREVEAPLEGQEGAELIATIPDMIRLPLDFAEWLRTGN